MTDDMMTQFKELAEQMEKAKREGQKETCPSCGYCPHCGRRNHDVLPYYPVPYWPTPWPYEPYRWTYVTSGGTSTTISLTS